jgi:predicted secreted protein
MTQRFGREDRRIVVPRGEIFEVELEPGGGGYEWSPRVKGDGIELVSEELVPLETRGRPSEAEPAIGAFAPVRFTFRARAKGSGTISFEHKRRWEATPRDAFEVSIEVK